MNEYLIIYTSIMHALPRNSVYGRGRGLRGPGGRRMVCVRQDKHYKPRTHPPCWVRRGLHGIIHSASDTIGPVGRSQQSWHEPA